MFNESKQIKTVVICIACLLLLSLFVPFMWDRTEVEAAGGATQDLWDLQIGDRVVDPNWNWDYIMFQQYYDYVSYDYDTVTKPVTWVVVAKDHYGEGSGVTLMSEELINDFIFQHPAPHPDNNSGANYWGLSGIHGGDKYVLRHWLNSTGVHASEGFYSFFSNDFKEHIVPTTVPNKECNGFSYTTTDNVFIPSATELGASSNDDIVYLQGLSIDYISIGEVFPYFQGDAETVRNNRKAYHPYHNDWSNPFPPSINYWTRTPNGNQKAHLLSLLFRDNEPNPDFDFGLTNVGTITWVRPVLNMQAETPVTKMLNQDGAYEFIYQVPDAGNSEISPDAGLPLLPTQSESNSISVYVNDQQGRPLTNLGTEEGQIKIDIQRKDGSALDTYDWIESVQYDYDSGVENEVQITIKAGSKTGSADDLVVIADRTVLTDGYSIAVVSGPPDQLHIETEPSSTAVAGEPFAAQPVLHLLDAYGNLATHDDNTVVTALISAGTGELVGVTTARAAGGIVSFENLAYETAETITIEFTAVLGATPVTVHSRQVSVDPGPFDNLVVESGEGGEIGTQKVGESFFICIVPRDRFGNVIPDFYHTTNLSSEYSFIGDNYLTNVNYQIAVELALQHTLTATIYSSEYAGHQGVSNTFNVERGTPPVEEWPQAAPIIYGDALMDSELSGGKVANELPGRFVFAEPFLKPEVGTHIVPVTFMPDNRENYQPISSTLEISVEKKPLVVSADSPTHIYNGNMFTDFTASFDGFVPGDSEGDLGSLRFTGPAVDAKTPGSYEIQIDHDALTADNYELILESGTLTINPAPLTVSADGKSKIYGAADPQLTYQIIAGQLFGEDTLTGALGREPGEGVGSYQITQASLDHSWYDITFTSAQLTIGQRPLSISADNKVKMQGEDDPELTVTYQGFAPGEDETNLAGALKLVRMPGEDLGAYAITPSGFSSDNYDIVFVPGELVITLESFVAPESADYIIGSGVDKQFTLTPSYGSQLNKILAGTEELIPGEDYQVSGNEYVIAAGFLESQPIAELPLTFKMDVGNNPRATINVRLSDQDSVATDKAALNLGFAPGDSAGSVSRPLETLPAHGANETKISWSSSHPDVLSADAQWVKRPAYMAGDMSVILTATINRGVETDTKEFELVVRKLPVTDFEAAILDRVALELEFTDTDSLNGVTGDLGLSGWGGYGSRITWTSSNTTYVTHGGEVTRPSRAAGNQQIRLTATLSRGFAWEVKEFDLIILADRELPAIASVHPAMGATDVSLDSVVTVEFTKVIQSGPNFGEIYLREKNGAAVGARFSINEHNLIVEPRTALDGNTEYELVIPQGVVRDNFGNSFETHFVLHDGDLQRVRVYQFTTETSLAPPVVESQYPMPGQGQRELNPDIRISFNEGVRQGNKFADIRLLDSDSKRVNAQVHLQGRTLSISPDTDLRPNARYNVFVPAGSIVNTSGVETENDFAFSFETGTAAMLPAPANNETDVAVNIAPRVLFDKPVTKGDKFADISLEDETGNSVEINVSTQDQTLIVTPVDNLSFSSDYTVILPAGSIIDESGQANDDYRFSFTTAQEISGNLLPFQFSPARHLLGDPVDFDASYIFLAMERQYSRELVDYSWDMGDGHTQAGRQINYSYAEAGDYTVTLTATDNKGQQFSLSVEVIVEALDNFTMSVSPGGTLLVYEPETEAQAASTFNYTVELSANGIPLQGRTISVSDTWEVTTNRDGRAVLTIARGELTPGNTNLSFRYEDRKVDRLVRMTAGSNSTYRFLINDYTEEDVTGLVVRLNGGRVPVSRDDDGFYVIENVPMGEQRLNISSSYYYDFEQTVDFYAKQHTGYVELTPDIPSERPVVTRITSGHGKNTLSDTGASNEFTYFQGTEAEVRLQATIDWHGHKPGYLLLLSPDGMERMAFTADAFRQGIGDYNFGELDMGKMDTGRFQVVAVSGHGSSSPAYDGGIVVAKRPPLGVAVFQGVRYELSVPLSLPGMATGRAPSGMPVFGSHTLGIDRQTVTLHGEIDEAGNLVYGVAAGADGYKSPFRRAARNNVSTKIGPVDIGGAIGAEYVFAPDAHGDWLPIGGYVSLELEGSVGYTQYFLIGPVPAYLDATIGASADARLGLLYTNKFEFHGELGMSPFVEVAIGAGAKGIACVEGYIRGSLGPRFVFSPEIDWYVQGQLKGGVRTQFLFMSAESEALVYTWNSNSTSVSGLGLLGDALAPPDQGELSMLPRTYLEAQSDWQPVRFGVLNQGVTDAAVNNRMLQENIYPQPQPSLIRSDDGIVMVWIADNPERADMNHTQLQCSIFDGSTWNTPEFIDFGEEAKTADFLPVLAKTDESTLLAWQKLNQELDQDATLEEMLAASEIAVANRDAEGNWAGYRMLTDNQYLDHSPRIAAAGDKAVLTWIRNRAGNYIGSADEPNEIMFSYWDGKAWSEPKTAASGVKGYAGADLAYNGKQGVLTFVVDGDEAESQNLYVITFEEGRWSNPVIISDGFNADPLVDYLNGELLLVWSLNDQLVYLKGDIEADFHPVPGAEPGVQDYILTTDAAAGLAAVSYSLHAGEGADIHTLFYEQAQDVWSREVRLTDNKTVSRPLDSVVDKEGNLKIVYTTLEWIIETIDGEEHVYPGQTDFSIASLSPRSDLAVWEEDITFSQMNPVPGSTVAITADISNIGEFSARDVEVAFFAGNPAEGGKQIGATQVIDSVIPARATAAVTVDWTVPQSEEEQEIYVVVDPDKKVADSDRSNNQAAVTAIAPDLELSDLRYQWVGGTRYLFTAEAANIGSIAVADSEIALYIGAAAEGESLLRATVPALESGEKTQVLFTWDAANQKLGDEGVDLTAQLIPPLGVNQYFEENSIYTVTLYKPALQIESFAPAASSRPVPVDQIIELNFNMAIQKADGDAAEINLFDGAGQSVEIDTEINDSTLRVRTVENLEHDQAYTLILDSAGVQGVEDNKLRQPFTLGFNTEPDYDQPTVIFTFPLDQMVDVALDTEVDITFNEDIHKGNQFDEISITTQNGDKVEYAASIRSSSPGGEVVAGAQGNVLHLEPAGGLRPNAIYTVSIPADSVTGSSGEPNREFSFSFTTVAGPEEDSDDTDDKGGGSRVGDTPGAGDGVSDDSSHETPQEVTDSTPGKDQEDPAGENEGKEPESTPGEDNPNQTKSDAARWLWFGLGAMVLTLVLVVTWSLFRRKKV